MVLARLQQKSNVSKNSTHNYIEKYSYCNYRVDDVLLCVLCFTVLTLNIEIGFFASSFFHF